MAIRIMPMMDPVKPDFQDLLVVITLVPALIIAITLISPKPFSKGLARQLAQCLWKVASRCAAKGFSVTADYFQWAYHTSASPVAE